MRHGEQPMWSSRHRLVRAAARSWKQMRIIQSYCWGGPVGLLPQNIFKILPPNCALWGHTRVKLDLPNYTIAIDVNMPLVRLWVHSFDIISSPETRGPHSSLGTVRWTSFFAYLLSNNDRRPGPHFCCIVNHLKWWGCWQTSLSMRATQHVYCRG